MYSGAKESLRIAPEYQPMFRALGLSAGEIFTSPLIKPWRTLSDRENCTLDFEFEGKPVRFHVKRYPRSLDELTPAEVELNGSLLLQRAGVAIAPVVGSGVLGDGRSFLISLDLDGYTPADKFIAAGGSFDRLIFPTADLAAKLHNANLHHRDLYLCHFMARDTAAGVDVSLIDTARVASLRYFFTRGRWIVKDIAQFWYSTLQLPITDEQREAWIKRYAEQRGLPGCIGLKKAVLGKVAKIARHDRSLNQKQPERNISIPSRAPSGATVANAATPGEVATSPAVQEPVRTQ